MKIFLKIIIINVVLDCEIVLSYEIFLEKLYLFESLWVLVNVIDVNDNILKFVNDVYNFNLYEEDSFVE